MLGISSSILHEMNAAESDDSRRVRILGLWLRRAPMPAVAVLGVAVRIVRRLLGEEID